MLYGYVLNNNKPRTYSKCIGIDGNEYIIRTDALVSGSTIHINGAMKAGKSIDITNQVFGHLIALYPTEKRAINGNVIWHCICDCGNKIKENDFIKNKFASENGFTLLRIPYTFSNDEIINIIDNYTSPVTITA